MNFDQAHAEFIQSHLARRSGERRGRLERGHREAERLFCQNVWWKLRGSFDGLHPEYEVTDWRGLAYFCDFVWIHPAVKLIIEIKRFGPHVRDMDRKKYSNELNRETFLTAMGYRVISFSYDDVAERPELCITLLRMLIGGFYTHESPVNLTGLAERETLRLACRLSRALRPIDVAEHLQVNHRTAVRTLQTLCSKGLFAIASNPDSKYVRKYEAQPAAFKLL
ncbi:Protein of unknown function [Cohnella sp. OV330]|uniref:DUF559 domain-containing protein n=1 Tax=Cohnella sp. OV330 TaxID=1855288 RepID=UPI0008E46A41|nr:DUF559 domain-containing protein [Cohnella sp. OV330]SFB49921.1 Protein of unknown function [Cohnella sp. OV330]